MPLCSSGVVLVLAFEQVVQSRMGQTEAGRKTIGERRGEERERTS